MPNRKKRLKKGIESLEYQIIFHEEKRAEAEQEGKVERVQYYDTEIEGLTKTKKKKEGQLEK